MKGTSKATKTSGIIEEGTEKTKRVSSSTLRRKWEKEKGQKWPKEPDNPNRNQSVSHKKALADGGTNEVENVEPKPWKEHQKEHKEKGDYKRWAEQKKNTTQDTPKKKE